MGFFKGAAQIAGELYVDTLTVEQIEKDVSNQSGGIKLDCSLEEAKRWTAFKFESKVNSRVVQELNKLKRAKNDK